MAIAKKGKRTLRVDERQYYWHLARDDHHPTERRERSIYVGSHDLKFIARYPLFQPDESRHIIVVGPEFGGVLTPGPLRRYRCPRFGDENIVYPSAVRELIDWCRASRSRFLVDEQGCTLS